MRHVRSMLCGVMAMIAAGCGVASAADRGDELTEAMITALLKDPISRFAIEPFSLATLDGAEILELDIIRQQRLLWSGWIAEIELKVDYGPPPPAVAGFERVRRSRYRLVVSRADGRLKLRRFTPIAQVELLPPAYGRHGDP